MSTTPVPKRSRWAAAAERRLTPASWLRAIWRQWPFLIALSIVIAGIVVVANDHFKRGTVIVAGGICVAAFLRMVLPNGWVGLLQVRSRFLDVFTLALLGGGTLIAALIVPPPS